MVKIGVFTSWVKSRSIEELAEKTASWGLDAVVLDSYPGLTMDPADLEMSTCRRIRQAFAAAGVRVAAIGGYSNIVSCGPVTAGR